MMQDNATIVRRFVDEVITQGKIDSAAQYVWEDVVEQVPLPGHPRGCAGLNRHVAREEESLQERRKRLHPDPESCEWRREVSVEA
jgi:hypothetical protein